MLTNWLNVVVIFIDLEHVYLSERENKLNRINYITTKNSCLKKMDIKINTLRSIDTEQPADCLEWCTHPDYSHHFICGTYHLEDGETDFSKAPTSMPLHNSKSTE